MPDENAVLEELMGNLREASGRLRASRRLLLEHAMRMSPDTCGWRRGYQKR